MCIHVYTHILYNTETLVGQKNKNLEHQWMLRAKEIFPLAILGTRALGS
jgi:hypothetical protein